MKNKFVVIIPTTRRSYLLSRTLDSLVQCLKPEGFTKTIVVENGPKSNIEKIVSKYNKALPIQYLYIERPNKANAMNEAVKFAAESFIYFSDDDVRYSKNVLIAYAKAFERRRHNEFYGGPVRIDYGKVRPPEWMMEFFPPSAKGYEINDGTNEIRRGRLALGFNWAVFSEDITTIGGFNPIYGPGSSYVTMGDESDIQERLLDASYRGVYVPEGLVWHYVPPERCNKRWLLKRAYNWGKEQGTKSKLDMPKLCQNWFLTAAKGLIRLSSGDEIKGFRSLYEFMLETGRVNGKWLSMKLSL